MWRVVAGELLQNGHLVSFGLSVQSFFDTRVQRKDVICERRSRDLMAL